MADLDIVTEVLVAELHRQGLLDANAIENMARRLIEAGEPDLGAQLLGVIIGNALDEPDERRRTFYIVDSGGNDTH